MRMLFRGSGLVSGLFIGGFGGCSGGLLGALGIRWLLFAFGFRRIIIAFFRALSFIFSRNHAFFSARLTVRMTFGSFCLIWLVMS
jgi:hypothetical protein